MYTGMSLRLAFTDESLTEQKENRDFLTQAFWKRERLRAKLPRLSTAGQLMRGVE